LRIGFIFYSKRPIRAEQDDRTERLRSTIDSINGTVHPITVTKGNPLMGNQIRTTILLAVLTALILWIGQILGGRQGMVIALIFAAGMNFFSYWYSDKMVLKMYRATEASRSQAPELYEIVQGLVQRAGLPMPKLYIIPQDAPNAFATGRNPEHAVVAVTQGLLKIMNRDEITGVLAHELAHVKNRDILIGSIAATMAGAIMMLATMAGRRFSGASGAATMKAGVVLSV
jgi:heat shock protein HtpX